MSKPVVLVIEDSEPNRLLLREELGFDGYEVLTAKSGQEGLELLQQQKVDVVILDIAMPNLNGIEATAQLTKSDSPVKAIILDECHQLTKQAWQAILKAIEEPPAHVLANTQSLLPVGSRM